MLPCLARMVEADATVTVPPSRKRSPTPVWWWIEPPLSTRLLKVTTPLVPVPL